MPATFAADSPAGIAAYHIFVLNLVPFGLQLLEEIVYPKEVFIPLPKDPFLLCCKEVVWCVYREIEFMCVEDQLLLEVGHCIAPPTGNGILIYREGCIGNHQCFIYADNLPKATANRAGTKWAVEIEHPLLGLLKSQPVCLEQGREAACCYIGLIDNNAVDCPFPFFKCTFDRVHKTRCCLLIFCRPFAQQDTVHHQHHLASGIFLHI